MPADPARISQITQPSRTATSEDAAVKTLSLGAREIEITSALYNDVDGAAENGRQFSLIKVSRDIYQAEITGQNGAYKVGQTVTVIYPRFGLSAGRDFMITGITERWGAGITSLTLWG